MANASVQMTQSIECPLPSGSGSRIDYIRVYDSMFSQSPQRLSYNRGDLSMEESHLPSHEDPRTSIAHAIGFLLFPHPSVLLSRQRMATPFFNDEGLAKGYPG